MNFLGTLFALHPLMKYRIFFEISHFIIIDDISIFTRGNVTVERFYIRSFFKHSK